MYFFFSSEICFIREWKCEEFITFKSTFWICCKTYDKLDHTAIHHGLKQLQIEREQFELNKWRNDHTNLARSGLSIRPWENQPITEGSIAIINTLKAYFLSTRMHAFFPIKQSKIFWSSLWIPQSFPYMFHLGPGTAREAEMVFSLNYLHLPLLISSHATSAALLVDQTFPQPLLVFHRLINYQTQVLVPCCLFSFPGTW